MSDILLWDKSGGEWRFMCTQKGELAYTENGGGKQVLLPDATEEFDLITDDDGNIHLIAQTSDGGLVYLIYDFENWKKHIILSSKSKNASIKSIKAFFSNEKIHCFYLLLFSGKHMLVHHIFSQNEKTAPPNVISYADCGKSLAVCADLSGKLHIFYFNDKSEFCHKIYDNGYSDGTFPTNDDVTEICPVYDRSGTLHLLFSARLKAYHTLIYFNTACKEKKTISFSDSPFKECRMQIRDKSVLIQWRDGGGFYEAVSDTGGESFKKPSPFNKSHSKKIPVRIRLARNPLCLDGDRIFFSSAERFIHTQATANFRNPKSNTKTPTDTQDSEHIKAFEQRLGENARELVRLNVRIDALSEKVKVLEKRFTESETPKGAPIHFSDEVGEINEENLRLFSSTDINDADFENPQIYK